MFFWTQNSQKKYGTEYVGGAHLVIFSLKDQQWNWRLKSSNENSQLAKAPEIKYILWGVHCILHKVSYFMAHTTATQ